MFYCVFKQTENTRECLCGARHLVGLVKVFDNTEQELDILVIPSNEFKTYIGSKNIGL